MKKLNLNKLQLDTCRLLAEEKRQILGGSNMLSPVELHPVYPEIPIEPALPPCNCPPGQTCAYWKLSCGWYYTCVPGPTTIPIGNIPGGVVQL